MVLVGNIKLKLSNWDSIHLNNNAINQSLPVQFSSAMASSTSYSDAMYFFLQAPINCHMSQFKVQVIEAKVKSYQVDIGIMFNAMHCLENHMCIFTSNLIKILE